MTADPQWSERGREFREAFVDGLEGSLMIPLTQFATLSANEVLALLAHARKELQDESLKPYMAL